MEIIKTPIEDLLVLKPKVFNDDRGYFYETWNQKNFETLGLNYHFVQDNESKSSYGVIRGLHYQLAPYSQAKLVRVLSGTVLDVAVDLRKKSPTFGQWHGIKLTAENKLIFLIPRGFAHGFAVLSKEATFVYKCDNIYMPNSERGIQPFDKRLDINWGIDENSAVLSDKDMRSPSFDDAEYNF